MSKNFSNCLQINTNKTINIIFFYPVGFSIMQKTLQKEQILLDRNQSLSEGLKNFLLAKGESRMGQDHYYYLQRGNKIIKELPKDKKIYDLDINDNDQIILSYKKYDVENKYTQNKKEILDETSDNILIKQQKSLFRRADIYNISSSKNKINNNNNINKKNNKKIKFIIGGLLLLTILFVLVYFFVKAFFPSDPETNILQKEELIIERNYPVNMLFRYTGIQNSKIKISGKDFRR